MQSTHCPEWIDGIVLLTGHSSGEIGLWFLDSGEKSDSNDQADYLSDEVGIFG